MEYKNIEVTTEDGILIITLNREDKMNALNMELLKELRKATADFNSEKSIKGVIITGKGAKAFAAGADIAEFSDFDSKQGKKMAKKGHETFNHLENSTKPVIAAVNGFALGGGCELAMACHLRLATPNAKFGQPEINLGIIPGYGGTQRLVQLIGKGKALEYLMTGDMISADEAHRLGLVNKVVEQDQLLSEAKNIINKIATKAPFAIAQVIKSVNNHFRYDVNGFKEEINSFAECVDTEDFKEGTSAFIGKRKAKFTGN